MADIDLGKSNSGQSNTSRGRDPERQQEEREELDRSTAASQPSQADAGTRPSDDSRESPPETVPGNAPEDAPEDAREGPATTSSGAALDKSNRRSAKSSEESGDFYEDYVLVTGASSGIGYATVAELLDADYKVLGSVRTQADADRLAQEFGDNFHPLIFDVTDADTVQAAAAQTRDIVGDNGLYGLVNNAGIAVGGPLQHLPLAEFRQPFDVNVFGTLTVTQAFLPLLGADHSSSLPAGRIVNISSISGHTVYPFVGPYAASKYALEALRDGLRRELLIYGIKVILVVPGSVNTPIWKKADAQDFERYQDTDYGPALDEIRKNVDDAGRLGMPVERDRKSVV